MDTTPLKRVGLLEKFTDDDLRVLGECVQRVRFTAGDEVLRQGQRNASLFVVQDGLLHVQRHAKEHTLLLGRLEPGSVFGEISLFDPGRTTATVQAVSDGTLLEIRREHLDQFLARCPSGAALLLVGLLEAMADRLRRTDERLMDSIVWGGLLK
jgi:CRP/FNR family transcriptional regulator, cyclic AMP receptor protein